MLIRTLADLAPGESAVIRHIGGTPSAERLRDVGFGEGVSVTCRVAAPGGDPVAFSVRGALIAIRKSEAAMITVR